MPWNSNRGKWRARQDCEKWTWNVLHWCIISIEWLSLPDLSPRRACQCPVSTADKCSTWHRTVRLCICRSPMSDRVFLRWNTCVQFREYGNTRLVRGERFAEQSRQYIGTIDFPCLFLEGKKTEENCWWSPEIEERKKQIGLIIEETAALQTHTLTLTLPTTHLCRACNVMNDRPIRSGQDGICIAAPKTVVRRRSDDCQYGLIRYLFCGGISFAKKLVSSSAEIADQTRLHESFRSMKVYSRRDWDSTEPKTRTVGAIHTLLASSRLIIKDGHWQEQTFNERWEKRWQEESVSSPKASKGASSSAGLVFSLQRRSILEKRLVRRQSTSHFRNT